MTVAKEHCGIAVGLKYQFSDILTDLMEQVKHNKFNLYNRSNRLIKGIEYSFSATKGFQKLGPNQVANWRVPPFIDNPQYVLATFKIKFKGNGIGNINITVQDVTEGFNQYRLDMLTAPLVTASLKFI